MVDLVKERHILSLKYDIAASDLDESVVPLMIVVSKLSEDIEKYLIDYEIHLKNTEKLLNKKVPQIYCDKPKTALLIGIGMYGSISLAVSIFLSVFWIGLVMFKTNEMKYEHLETLSKIVKYDSKSHTYFIGREDFKMFNKGIILTKKK